LVAAHTRALTTRTSPEGVTVFVYADLHEPEVVIDAARDVLNLE
jgi:hypothetical protein